MRWHRFCTVRSAMVVAVLISLSLVACGGGDKSETVEITGTTGECLNVDGPWTGEPVGGAPGSVQTKYICILQATTVALGKRRQLICIHNIVC